MKRHRFWILGCLLAVTAAHAAAAEYAITDLGPSDGWSNGAVAMNNRGWIAGATDARGWLRSPAGELTYIDTPPGFNGIVPADINDEGAVVGRLGLRLGSACFGAAMPAQHAFYYRHGRLTDIPPPPGPPPADGRAARRAWAVSVSNTGEVTIVADTPEGPVRPFLWKDGAYQMNEAPDMHAIAGNGAGVSVGTRWDGPETRVPYVRREGKTEDLPLLDAGDGKASGQVTAVNASGVIIGASKGADGKTHACSWKDGKITDLGGLLPVVTSVANGINAAGTIVGESGIPPSVAPPNGTQHAVLWEGGRIVDLNTLIPPDSGWTLTSARTITDSGLILARGRKGGEFRSCLLTPAAGR